MYTLLDQWITSTPHHITTRNQANMINRVAVWCIQFVDFIMAKKTENTQNTKKKKAPRDIATRNRANVINRRGLI